MLNATVDVNVSRLVIRFHERTTKRKWKRTHTLAINKRERLKGYMTHSMLVCMRTLKLSNRAAANSAACDGYLSRNRILFFQKMNKSKNLRRLLPKGSISKVLSKSMLNRTVRCGKSSTVNRCPAFHHVYAYNIRTYITQCARQPQVISEHVCVR